MTMTVETFAQGEGLWREHENYIRRTAGDIARSFWKVEREDVEQEIWVFLWEKEEYFVEHNCSEAYIRKCILNCARNYAQKQRNTTLLESDTFYYSQEEIKELLPTFLGGSYEEWTKASPLPPGSETMTKNDALEIMLDIALAWERLSEGQKDILSRRYQDGEEFPEGSERKTLSRATKRLMELLNQHADIKAKSHEGPGAHLSNPAVKKMHERDSRQDRGTGLSRGDS